MTDTLLLAGTRKGLLLARRRGGSWDTEPLALPMTAVYAVAIDARRATPRLFASATSEHWGPTILHSDDLGASWSEPDHAPVAFPSEVDTAVARVWQIQPGPVSEPDVVYAGTEPAALFRSEDGGLTYELNRALWEHPHRKEWGTGAGGQAIHTILPHPADPPRILIALSSGGVYRSFDAGTSWTASNTGIKATFLPEDQRYPEFGQCVHKVAQDSGNPERLYLQNHNGVYRSDDWGGTWTSIAEGLPGEFGFPIVADPRRADHAYLFPLVSDYSRFTPDFRFRVFGTSDAGETWSEVGKGKRHGNDHGSNGNNGTGNNNGNGEGEGGGRGERGGEGLPETAFYSIVLRDALTADANDPLGLYFGTRSGELYAGGEDSWQRVAANLPDVLSVRATALA